MKIVIVENPRPLTFEHYNDVANAPLSASLSSGYALAVARRAGWDSVHLDFTSTTDNPETIAALILIENADIILLHWVYSWGHEETVRTLINLMRRESSAPMGAFGLFPTLARERLLEFAPQLNFILAGEFEETLAELLTTFNPGLQKPLPGLALQAEPFVPRPLIEDLSQLPVPDDAGANLCYPSLNIATSRGCYGDCSFCFIKPYYGCSRRRTRSAASLEQELELRLARRPVENLYFIDPTFIGQGQSERERAIAISRIAHAAGLPFGFETRVDTVDQDLMATLARNGASSVFLGIESGCDSVLRRINKRITKQQIIDAVRIVQVCGLQLNIGFIMFEPDSTLDNLAENFAFLEGLGLLDELELTVNLLYHNQIVLYGSPAWLRFEQEERLLLDKQLPFEARYRFRDERVGLVCAAMGRLASEYFRATENHGNRQTAADDVNNLIKQAFCSLLAAVGSNRVDGITELEAGLTGQLQQTF